MNLAVVTVTILAPLVKIAPLANIATAAAPVEYAAVLKKAIKEAQVEEVPGVVRTAIQQEVAIILLRFTAPIPLRKPGR